MQATGEFFGVDNAAFNRMVSTNDEASNRMLEDLLRTFTAAADQEENADEKLRHTWRVGFLTGIKFTRLGFAS